MYLNELGDNEKEQTYNNLNNSIEGAMIMIQGNLNLVEQYIVTVLTGWMCK